MKETKNNLNNIQPPAFPPTRQFQNHWLKGMIETPESIQRTKEWRYDLSNWKNELEKTRSEHKQTKSSIST